MLKYAKIIDEKTGLCQVGLGTNSMFYKQIGMKELDVAQSQVDNQWYLAEKLDTDDYRKKIQEMERDAVRADLQRQLNEIDLKSIRALRCCETDRLEQLENQAKELRQKLNS